MKLPFGLQLIRPSAPRIPKHPSVTEVLPNFNTLAPLRGPETSATASLDEREISADPREQFYLALGPKLSPSQVVQILRSAQSGDLWQSHQLFLLMLEWPMFRKCTHELSDAVASVRYVARPFVEEGKEPTKTAKAKADLVNRCFRSMQPDQFSDERDFRGMVYQFVTGMFNGISIEEILWDKPRRYPGVGMERRPRAAAWTHPRHFTFSDAGTIALFDDAYNRLMFPLAGNQGATSPDPRKFICAQFYSHSGSTLSAGFMRPLAHWWCVRTFGIEWIARSSQNFGAPFVDLVYRPGMTPTELSQLDANVKQGLANRYIRHIEGTVLNVAPAQTLGSDNPQRYLLEEADRQAQLLLLGQTLTTDTSDNGGSLALGKVHEGVLQSRVEGVAKWVAADPLTNLARSILLVNYGNVDELPCIEPDFSKPLSAIEQATYLQTISNVRIPLHAEEVYTRAGMSMPEEGDKVIIAGNIGAMTSQEVPLGPEADMAREEEMMSLQATSHPDKVLEILRSKTPAQLRELDQLVTAAERKDHINGEYEEIAIKFLGRAKM